MTTRSGAQYQVVYDDGGFEEPDDFDYNVVGFSERSLVDPTAFAPPEIEYPTVDSFFPRGVESLGMNTFKRSRNVFAPVATTSAVNYSTANRVINLSGREFVQDVVSAIGTSSAFACQSKLLRPTDGDLFSWLCSIAKKFEEFKFHQLRFIYEPQVPSTVSGQVGLFFDGDPTHLQPGNWNGFVNTGANAHGAVWAKHVLNVPPWLFSSRKSYYTISEFADANATTTGTFGSAPAKAADPMEYFPGLFGVVSEGVSGTAQAGVVIGKVYLEYNISLKTQNVDGYNITTSNGSVANTELATNSGSGYFFKLSTYPTGTNQYPFGTEPVSGPYTVVTSAGSNPFKAVTLAANVYKQAVSQLNLLVVSRWTAAAAADMSLEIAPPVSSNVAPTFTQIASNSLPGATVVGAYAQVIKDNTNNGGAATTDMTGAWQVFIPAGFFFRMKCTQIPTYFHVMFAPWTFAVFNS